MAYAICEENKHTVFLGFYVTELMKIAMFPSYFYSHFS